VRTETPKSERIEVPRFHGVILRSNAKGETVKSLLGARVKPGEIFRYLIGLKVIRLS